MTPATLTDPTQAPLLNAVLTFFFMGVLALASMRLKKWVCRHDRHMKRAKRLVEELYSIATGMVVLCIVTDMQYVLLGGVVHGAQDAFVVSKTGLSLVGKLTALSLGSVFIMFVAAVARTRLARVDIFLALDEAGVLVPQDLESSLPRLKKFLIHVGLIGLLLIAFWVSASIFAANVQLLRS